MKAPPFEADDLASDVETLKVEDMDRLPYGVIKLDARGVVQIYSWTEATESGRRKRPTVGLNFWRDVAPCMAGSDMRGLVEAAAAQGAVDVVIGWIGDFDDPDGEIQIRAISAMGGGLWLFMKRASD